MLYGMVVRIFDFCPGSRMLLGCSTQDNRLKDPDRVVVKVHGGMAWTVEPSTRYWLGRFF